MNTRFKVFASYNILQCLWFYPCSYICNCLKMPKKSQINEYSDNCMNGWMGAAHQLGPLHHSQTTILENQWSIWAPQLRELHSLCDGLRKVGYWKLAPVVKALDHSKHLKRACKDFKQLYMLVSRSNSQISTSRYVKYRLNMLGELRPPAQTKYMENKLYAVNTTFHISLSVLNALSRIMLNM